MARCSDYMLAYDVSGDRERRQVEKLLSAYGFRRQKSVFVCRLTRGDKARLLARLEALSLQSGFVLVAPLAHCNRIKTIGVCDRPDPDAGYAFIV